jgi:hypothetical protein
MAMGEEDDEDDLGSFVPPSFALAIKFEILCNQNAFNASVRGVKIDGIHKDVIYNGAMPMMEETEEKANTLYHYMCKVNNKEGTQKLFCAIDESPKIVEWGHFVFHQCYEEDVIEAKEYLDT